jgi:hypothetical protein
MGGASGSTGFDSSPVSPANDADAGRENPSMRSNEQFSNIKTTRCWMLGMVEEARQRAPWRLHDVRRVRDVAIAIAPLRFETRVGGAGVLEVVPSPISP